MFIESVLAFPCDLNAAQKTYLAYAFSLTQRRLPINGRDLDFVCALLTDPIDPQDITVLFPGYRNIDAEQLAIKNFVNFFQRPPSLDVSGAELPAPIAAHDWWAVKYMAYHLRLKPTARNVIGERRCVRLFMDRDVDLYKDGVKIRKSQGGAPQDVWDHDFIRACAYSGAGFFGTFAPVADALHANLSSTFSSIPSTFSSATNP